ncbi:MAG: nitroreductase [Bacteroidetes bacterium]|nr:MAG: nitroreductase [Bacteroidota bacterium]
MIEAAQFDSMIRLRRSVKPEQFVPGKKIPDEWILNMLENANTAPSHKLTEPWRFTIFSGKGLERLAHFQSDLYKKNAGEKFNQVKFDKLQQTPLLCSHIIAIGMKRNSVVPEVEEIASVACAVENLWLSTSAYGVGGYWSTGGVTYYPEAKSFFGLGELDKLLGFFFLGFVQVPSVKSNRKPVTDKISWIRE